MHTYDKKIARNGRTQDIYKGTFICIQTLLSSKIKFEMNKVQVNLFQKHSFLLELTHNTTTDFSLKNEFSTRKIEVQNMLCRKIVLNAKTKTKNNFCTQHILIMYFSRTEVVNQ